ncbi:DUF1707 domain-containing protein [Streptomyces sp. NPDC097619]|uniref:DUF1707 domain-containing protein n=1 Tax=Streptomyces sp. NPDC097619 TaxID=3157228 RepID=UPI003333EF0C
MSDEQPQSPESPGTAGPARPADPAGPAKSGAGPAPHELRASDADRELVVERLREAVAEGRLDMDEFEERMTTAYASRTYGELEPLTRDLPGAGGAPLPVAHVPAAPVPAGGASPEGPRVVGPPAAGVPGGSAVGVAVLGAFERKGTWTVPSRFQAVAFWGAGVLDLREARFEAREVVINCVAVMGSVEIVVPPGVEVDMRGVGIMGAFEEHRPKERAKDRGKDVVPYEGPATVRVVVTGLAFWGAVEIKHKPRRNQGPGGGRVDLRKEL